MMRRSAVVIGVVVCAMVVVHAQAQAQERPADEQAVRQLVQAIANGLNARDYGAAAAVFSEDGDLIVARSRRVSGRSAIRALWQETWSALPRELRIALTVRSLRFFGPDVAIADATGEFTPGQPS